MAMKVICMSIYSVIKHWIKLKEMDKNNGTK